MLMPDTFLNTNKKNKTDNWFKVGDEVYYVKSKPKQTNTVKSNAILPNVSLEDTPNLSFNMPTNTLGFSGMSNLTNSLGNFFNQILSAINVAGRNNAKIKAQQTKNDLLRSKADYTRALSSSLLASSKSKLLQNSNKQQNMTTKDILSLLNNQVISPDDAKQLLLSIYPQYSNVFKDKWESSTNIKDLVNYLSNNSSKKTKKVSKTNTTNNTNNTNKKMNITDFLGSFNKLQTNLPYDFLKIKTDNK